VSKRRVVVTGLGTINPLGNNVSDTWNNLINGVSGIDYISSFETDGLPVTFDSSIPRSSTKRPLTFSKTSFNSIISPNYVVKPPSTGITCPVIYSDSSSHKKATTFDISSGFPMRLIESCSIIFFLFSSSRKDVISVSM